MLQRGTDLRARAVQKHSLVSLAELENATHLRGVPTFDVAQRDHDPLAVGEARDRVGDQLACLGGEESAVRLGRPGRRERDPAAWMLLVGALEAVGRKGQLVLRWLACELDSR